ncbi:aldo/keto reductase [Atractiella rhizophila]|nr:aldo/keto reductase [Atractiella rhizophila]
MLTGQNITIKGLSKSTTIGRIGYGLLSLTAKNDLDPVSESQAIEAIKSAIDGGSTYLNAGEFYGPPSDFDANIKLLNRFFSVHPEYADKCFLCVKGAFDMKTYQPTCSKEGLKASVENITRLLGGKKRLDMFSPARVDATVPIEQVARDLKALVEEGLFDYVGMSECSAQTIRKAHAICPISLLEEEYSPFSLDVEKNGVLDACKELGIPIIAYSPISRGILSGQWKQPTELDEKDLRRTFDRFQPDNWDHNQALVNKFLSIAERKGVTAPQLCLAWILKQWEGFVPIPGSSRPHVVRENLKALDVVLTDEEAAEVRDAVQGVVGGRYNKFVEHTLAL